MQRAAIYARYSSAHQREESIEGQVRICLEYAAKHDLVVIKKYIDRSISGKTDARPSFQQMIADAKQRCFDVLLIYSTDRFARNKYDSAIYKTQLKKAGVRIAYTAEAIPDGPEGILMESLMEGLAEYYSAELARKIKRGMHENALNCKATGPTPFGYLIDAEHHYKIDPIKGPEVQKLFEMYVAGASQQELISYLNNRGLQTRLGHPFTKGSIQTILSNRMYLGEYRHAEVIIEHGVPALISLELFEKAQQERKNRQRVNRIDHADYYLSGKLFFQPTGRPMVGVSGTNRTGTKYCYYSDKQKHTVPKNKIEDLVFTKTLEFLLNPLRLKEISNALAQYQKSQNNNTSAAARVKELKRKQSSMISAIENGVNNAAFINRLNEIEKEIKLAESELEAAQVKIYSSEQLKEMLEHYLKEPKESVKEKVLRGFIYKVFYHPDIIQIIYNATNATGELEKEDLSSPADLFGGAYYSSEELKVIKGFIVVSCYM